jgi:glycosyltransferase involved in cell wall biosynthesis
MKVSVLIPTYNRQQYITEAINSVLAQDYDEIEIIVVDDGSTDNTQEVIKPFLNKIQYIRTDNQGPAKARNVCMRAASGEYVAYLDDDDLYYPNKIGLQAQLLDRRPDVGMVYTEFSAFSDNGFWDEFHLQKYHESAYKRDHLSYDTLFNEKQHLSAAELPSYSRHKDLEKWSARCIYYGNIFEAYLFNTVVFTNSMMFRRDLLTEVGMQQPKFGLFHDLEFALRLCKHTKVAFIDIPTYKLRYHPQQISTTNKQHGELVAIKKQRDLLRVTKFHGKNDPAFYSRNKDHIDQQLSILCRAVALPLLAYAGNSKHADKYFPKRARQYLAKSNAYGRAEYLLYVLSYAPHLVRRIAFKLMAMANTFKVRFRRHALR